MPSLNKVMLIGNVGRDPEVRYLDQGAAQGGQSTKVATFTLATTDRYRDRNGEVRENTEWHNLVLWRQLADLAEKFIRKGSQVYIEGHLRTRSYTDQQGVKKFVTEIVADNVQLLGRREGEGIQPVAGGYAPAASGYQSSPAGFQPQGGYQAPSYQTPAYQAPAQGPQSDGYRKKDASAPLQPDFGAPAAGDDDLPF
ncbi:MAG: single-stranded DNA-binding protein [Bacteroidales bacterium]|nr:single-stranded DNA-binding protein [Bacteroidales bacterium]MBP5381947.1 single-stranded DNA-binding protein [Bacteroidales bacterium]MBP5521440.1 single-stranded DNA-binding protein [Bacteroidales bacterium]